MTKIYISGKITGIPIERAIVNFAKAKEYIEENKMQAVNPMELPHKHNQTWESYMRENIAALVYCDGIYMQKNWETSKGAKVEYGLAKELGLKVYFE